MTTGRIYHVGIVVPDLESSMAELSEVAGLTWGRVQQYPVDFETPSGRRRFEPRFVMSLEGTPHIELLDKLADSPWAHTGLHHLGLWSADVAQESADIEARGCLWEVAIPDSQGRRSGGCYHFMSTVDARVELVSRADSAPRLERYLAGGDYQ
jgi:hypothetical protein